MDLLVEDERHMRVERYARAAAFLPAILNPKLGGRVTEGYWVDNERFFYRLSRRSTPGRSGSVPMIADMAAGTTSPAISMDTLAALLCEATEAELEPDELEAAQFDMPSPTTLVVTLGRRAFTIALPIAAIAGEQPLNAVPRLYSPDGKRSCVLKDHAIWIEDRATGAARRLSEAGEPGFAFGYAPEFGIAPVSERKACAPSGLWSADSAWFVTHRIDERHLEQTVIVENAPPNGGRPVGHVFRVASPDLPPPLVEYHAFHVQTGRQLSVSACGLVPQVGSPFAFRQCWIDGARFYFLAFDRFSSEVALHELDLTTGAERVVVEERTAKGWLDLHPLIGVQPMVRTVASSSELIWYSERDGWGHLYLYDLTNGALNGRITGGEWMVREIVHVDAARRRILFLASGLGSERDPGSRQFYRIGFDGRGLETVAELDGDLDVRPDPMTPNGQDNPFRPSYAAVGASADARFAFVVSGDIDVPTQASILDLDGGGRLPLGEVDIRSHWQASLPRPFQALAADGTTELRGAMYLPSDFDETMSYPIVDFIYPGPQANPLVRRFPSITSMLLQSVAELGLVTIVCEARGMPLRSRAFHQAGWGRLSEPQLADTVAVLRQLGERHAFIDPDRVGIFGQSGGGYAAARAMFDYPEVFKAAVSICGNHDSRNYIAYWLNKYGGRPGTAERDEQSNIAVAHKLRGQLFLVHGDMDENVHVGHTLALSASLIDAGKIFDQLIVPNAGHNVLMESAFVLQRLWDFFARHLLHTEPSADFVLRYPRTEK